MSKMKNFMKGLDRGVNWVSWGTIIALCAWIVAKRVCGYHAPDWAETWLVPILTAGAVGYITNWVAIYLLFKPYEPICGIQGIIPRSKPDLGRALGQEIPERLLKPDELVAQLDKILKEYLHEKSFLDTLKSNVANLVKEHSGKLAGFIIQQLEGVLKDLLDRELNQENLAKIYDNIVVNYLTVPANRESLASGILSEIKTRAPEITHQIKEELRTSAAKYLNEEWPKLTFFFSGETIANKFVDSWLNWDKIQKIFEQKLSEESTMKSISEELQGLTIKFQTWLRSPTATDKLKSFIDTHKGKIETFIKDYLTENLPTMANDFLSRPSLWIMIEKDILPEVEKYLCNELRKNKDFIIQKLDLPGKIESSVQNMDVKELHTMINNVSGEHLTLIQLLGYILGLIAGFGMVFA